MVYLNVVSLPFGFERLMAKFSVPGHLILIV